MAELNPIIGPPSRPADDLAHGFRWCSCGLHQYPSMIGHSILRVATGCPVCVDYQDQRPVKKPATHVVTWLTDDSQRIPRESA